jgi:hypothetical protein
VTTLLSLDPGLRGCGVALFRDGVLTACSYVKNPETKGAGPDAVLKMADAVYDWSLKEGGVLTPEIVFEHPQAYTAGHSKGDNNDLFPLVGVAYALATMCHPVTKVLPREWKGQLEKDACHARIRSRLSPAELAVFESVKGHFAHNAWDACGVGLHHLGRFERTRVFAKE